MKRITALCLLILIVILGGCGQVTDDKTENTTTVPVTESELDLLRKKYPQYFDLGTFKGIEVYVWQMSENSYYCGALAGTNRNKTQEEIWSLTERAVPAEDMIKILSTYPNKDEIFIIPCIQPISSYAYSIDDEYIKKLEKIFEGYSVVRLSTLDGFGDE